MRRDTRILIVLMAIAVASMATLWACNYRAE